MYFRQLFDSGTAAISYLLADPPNAGAVAIDPNPDPCHGLLLKSLLAERKLELGLILLTHTHGDSLEGLAEQYPGAEIIAGTQPRSPGGYRAAIDDEIFCFGNERIRVIATPGHTAFSVSYLWRDRLFCGDALELGGCGLSEDRECDPGRIYDSVTTRLFALPDEALVFPGHDFHGRTVSTIGEERQRNPFFLARSRDAFVTAFRARQQRGREGLVQNSMVSTRS
jgi:glyoxylase-like metal-dependent hydrolase (beta-lactamase superfamily II)